MVVSPGIIPAYAGNTRRRDTATLTCWDHPRICGEHTLPTRLVAATVGDHPRICGEHVPTQKAMDLGLGSSPHMRGTHDGTATFRSNAGIIPAYAGNTIIGRGFIEDTGDHPRICGEHLPSGNGWRSPKGSSPHMRGTQGGFYRVHTPDGIIPAYAGNTPTGHYIA